MHRFNPTQKDKCLLFCLVCVGPRYFIQTQNHVCTDDREVEAIVDNVNQQEQGEEQDVGENILSAF